jgi:hypothetical protein
MIVFYLTLVVGCAVKTYAPEARITSLAPGGGAKEFFVASELYCGPMLFPRLRRDQWVVVNTTITWCEARVGPRDSGASCAEVAETETLGLAIGNSDRFEILESSTLCRQFALDFILKDHVGESGWTPTSP